MTWGGTAVGDQYLLDGGGTTPAALVEKAAASGKRVATVWTTCAELTGKVDERRPEMDREVLVARSAGLYGIKGMTSVVFANVALMAGACIALVVIGNFWASVPLLVLAGFAMNNSSIATLNLMQNAVHGQIRGRVMSIYTVILQGAPALGTLLIGAVAEVTGLPWPVAISSACGLALWFLMLPRIKPVRAALEIDAPDEKSPAKAPA